MSCILNIQSRNKVEYNSMTNDAMRSTENDNRSLNYAMLHTATSMRLNINYALSAEQQTVLSDKVFPQKKMISSFPHKWSPCATKNVVMMSGRSVECLHEVHSHLPGQEVLLGGASNGRSGPCLGRSRRCGHCVAVDVDAEVLACQHN